MTSWENKIDLEMSKVRTRLEMKIIPIQKGIYGGKSGVIIQYALNGEKPQ